MNEFMEMSKGGGSVGPKPIDPNEQVSRKLRQFYDGVRDEQVPERFLDLLEKLDAAEQKAGRAAGTSASRDGENERS